jgi:hypothetical protein
LRFAVTQQGKRGLLALGHYRRALGQARFPGVVVLCYHGLRGDDWPAGSMPFENLHVRASTFEQHCRILRETCDPISLDDWRAAISGGTPLPARPVLLTFDDGYRSVLTIGAGVLAANRLPAVVFACTEPMERRRLLWFDDLAAREGEEAVQSWKSRGYGEWLDACASRTAAVGDDDPRALLTPTDVAPRSRQRAIEKLRRTERRSNAGPARGSALSPIRTGGLASITTRSPPPFSTSSGSISRSPRIRHSRGPPSRRSSARASSFSQT